MSYTLEQLNELYDLELKKVVKEINQLCHPASSKVYPKRVREPLTRRSSGGKSKIVLLQFPDGLKPYATAVVDYLEKETNACFLIWFGSCYGACDTPILGKDVEKKIDLIIQFGHSKLMPDYQKDFFQE